MTELHLTDQELQAALSKQGVKYLLASYVDMHGVPKSKMVVLGLVTTKRGALESKDQLKRRIVEASQYIDLDQLCLSPQCGFSSTVEGNSLTFSDEVAKLRLVIETAHEVWG